jgi:hypothetical protein
LQSKVIEQVTYQLADGVSESEFLIAADQSDEWLRACAGFIERRLGKQPGTDRWLDLVFWETLESALAAAAQFNASPATAPFNRCLKKGSVSMSHYEWRSSTSGRVG